MLIVLSPSKALDESPRSLELASSPVFAQQANELVVSLQDMSVERIGALMSLSDKLSALTVARFDAFGASLAGEGAGEGCLQKQAMMMFAGDTYKDIDVSSYDESDWLFAQRRVRILSGLYGVLAPLDLIQPYRLEMGTRLANARGKDLYAYWGSSLGEHLERLGQEVGSRVLVNLASVEYFKAVDISVLSIPVVTPVFKDLKSGVYKVISFYAKRARGMMADFIIREQLDDVDALRTFSRAGYCYDEESSTPWAPVFLRDC